MTNLKTELMSHQNSAFNKLKDIKACALFMDMGTGKTRTTLEFINYRKLNKKINKVLWICPVNTKLNLQKDITKHSCFTHSCIENHFNEEICIVGMESISQSDRIYGITIDFIKKTKDCMLVVDESHMIKNHKAKRTERVMELAKHAKYRLIMTGTPITNGIWDVFTQMYVLHPKILGYNSFYSFARIHLEYSDRFPGMVVDCHKMDYLTKKMNPYIYQITKKECLDLPPKNYQNRYIHMSDEHRKVYESIKEYFLNKINPEQFDSITIFNMLGYLHRVCGGFIDVEFKDYNKTLRKNIITKFKFKTKDKAEVVKTELDNIPKEAKKIVWYRYNSDLDLLKEVIKDEYVVISGSIKKEEREKNINDFTSGPINIALINISVGGTGLNLQEANYMIYYNNTYDYAKRMQSEDRIYRIGQNKNVHIIDILYNYSIDTRIDDSIERKSSIIKDIRKMIQEIKDNKEEIEKFKEEILNEW